MVAEKLHAMVEVGHANSRMKDFYDIMRLSQEFDFDGAELATSIAKTFERRGTEIPRGELVAFSEAFVNDEAKRGQWKAFTRKAGVDGADDFGEVVASVRC